jgi:DNA-binding response OmpR family regulator
MGGHSIMAAAPPEPFDSAWLLGTGNLSTAGLGAVIDFARFRVLVDGSAIHLTYTEFAILQALVRSDGVPLSRSDLKFVLTGGQAADSSDRAVDVHIRRVRAKFGPYSDIIRTVHGRGYRFDPRRNVIVSWSGAPSPDRV